MSSAIYTFKRLQCLYLRFKDLNVFSHLHFQRLECLQSFTLSKDQNVFIYIYKTSMSFIIYILQSSNVFCLLHLIRLQRLLSFIGLNILVFVLLRTQYPLLLCFEKKTSMSSCFFRFHFHDFRQLPSRIARSLERNYVLIFTSLLFPIKDK